jgi:hypothetical protein
MTKNANSPKSTKPIGAQQRSNRAGVESILDIEAAQITAMLSHVTVADGRPSLIRKVSITKFDRCDQPPNAWVNRATAKPPTPTTPLLCPRASLPNLLQRPLVTPVRLAHAAVIYPCA